MIWLAAAASREQQSEHPLASATRGSRPREKPCLPKTSKIFSSTTGGGVIAKKGGAQIIVGQPAFLRANGIAGLEDLEARVRRSPQNHYGLPFRLKIARPCFEIFQTSYPVRTKGTRAGRQ